MDAHVLVGWINIAFPHLNQVIGSAQSAWLRSASSEPPRRDRWMIAPAADVPKLQQPLPGGSLSTVATGVKEDGDEDGPATTA
jgi:hypothetical protein